MKPKDAKPKPSVKETLVLKFGEFRSHLGDELNKTEYGGRRVVIERRGRKSAAIISVEDLRALEAFEQQAKPASDVF